MINPDAQPNVPPQVEPQLPKEEAALPPRESGVTVLGWEHAPGADVFVPSNEAFKDPVVKAEAARLVGEQVAAISGRLQAARSHQAEQHDDKILTAQAQENQRFLGADAHVPTLFEKIRKSFGV